ncbi:MAG: GyrI-like domain-containing protein [Clostridiales bacterium]|jgi:predicted transcriptional regulator YdeE|nr:GyrI-like domain-containing protein [Clostridiales bacterium]
MDLDYKVEEKDAFRIVGLKTRYESRLMDWAKEIPELWERCLSSMPEIVALMTKEPYSLIGVSVFPNEGGLDYYVSTATDRPFPDGDEEWAEYIVPANRWAIFECVGSIPDSLSALKEKIAKDFSDEKYDRSVTPCVEVYPEGDQKAPDYRCEYWIPLTDKKEFRFVEKEEIRALCLKTHFDKPVQESADDMYQFWKDSLDRIEGMIELINMEPYGMLGVSDYTDDGGFDYYIGASTINPITEETEDLTEYTIPAGTWVIFESIGAMPDAISAKKESIEKDWFPTSKYERTGAPDIDVYLQGDQESEDYRCLLYVQVKEKPENS